MLLRVDKSETLLEPLLCCLDGYFLHWYIDPVDFKDCSVPDDEEHWFLYGASAEAGFGFASRQKRLVDVVVSYTSGFLLVLLAKLNRDSVHYGVADIVRVPQPLSFDDF